MTVPPLIHTRPPHMDFGSVGVTTTSTSSSSCTTMIERHMAIGTEYPGMNLLIIESPLGITNQKASEQ